MAIRNIVIVISANEIDFSQIVINTAFSKNAILQIIIFAYANDGRIAQSVVFVVFFTSGGQHHSKSFNFVAFLNISSSSQKPLSPDWAVTDVRRALWDPLRRQLERYFGASCLGGHFQLIVDPIWASR